MDPLKFPDLNKVIDAKYVVVPPMPSEISELRARATSLLANATTVLVKMKDIDLGALDRAHEARGRDEEGDRGRRFQGPRRPVEKDGGVGRRPRPLARRPARHGEPEQDPGRPARGDIPAGHAGRQQREGPAGDAVRAR